LRSTGQVIPDPCTVCHGETRVTKELKLKVKVPPGVESGTRIRYAGEGDAGRAGAPRRPLCVLSLRAMSFLNATATTCAASFPSAFPRPLSRRDRDCRHRRPSHSEVPEGTPSGKELRVRAKGIPFLNEKGTGDLIVKVMVEIPRKLSRASASSSANSPSRWPSITSPRLRV